MSIAVTLMLSSTVAGDGAPAPEDARRAAADIVAGDAFSTRSESLLQRFVDWLAGLGADDDLDPLPSPDPVAGPAPGRGTSSTVVWLLVAVVVIVVIVLVVLAARRRARAIDGGTDEDERTDEALPVEPDVSGWEADARRLEAESRWAEAVRARYRAGLGHLVDAGWVVPAPGRTTGELRRQVDTGPPTVADAFGELTGLFEQAWYEGRDSTADDAARSRQLVSAVGEAAVAVPPSRRRLAGDEGADEDGDGDRDADDDDADVDRDADDAGGAVR